MFIFILKKNYSLRLCSSLLEYDMVWRNGEEWGRRMGDRTSEEERKGREEGEEKRKSERQTLV